MLVIVALSRIENGVLSFFEVEELRDAIHVIRSNVMLRVEAKKDPGVSAAVVTTSETLWWRLSRGNVA
jgi:hypothetical protein